MPGLPEPLDLHSSASLPGSGTLFTPQTVDGAPGGNSWCEGSVWPYEEQQGMHRAPLLSVWWALHPDGDGVASLCDVYSLSCGLLSP